MPASVIALTGVAALAFWQPWKAKPAPVPSTGVAASASEPKPAAAVAPAPVATAPGAVAPAPVVNARSIAVLPFENRSDEKGSEFFTDGIHDNILTSLANLGQLQVTSRTSVMEYRGTKKKISQIGRELNVAFVLEGAVQRAGNTVLITGQLIRAATDEHVWAKNFPPRELTAANIFALQSELAQAIAGELKAVISPQEKNLLARRPTENLAALDLYLKAQAVTGRTRADYRNQESWLQTAVELDPTFALAWSKLAEVHAEIRIASLDPTSARVAKAKAAIDRAVALAPESPEVIRALGVYYMFAENEPERARAQFEALLRLQPNDAATRLRLGVAQLYGPHWPAAIASLRAATLLEPSNPEYARTLALNCWAVRRYDEAIAEMRRLMTLQPDNLQDEIRFSGLSFEATGSTREGEELLARLEARTPPPSAVGWVRQRLALQRRDYTEFLRLDEARPRNQRDSGAQSGAISQTDYDTALAAGVLRSLGDNEGARRRFGDLPARLRARLELEPKNTQLLRTLAITEAILGNGDEALRRITEAAEIVPMDRAGTIGLSIRKKRAEVYAWSEDKERAIDEMAQLLRLPVPQMNVHVLRGDPAFASLRGDPRWEALLNDPKNNAPLF